MQLHRILPVALLWAGVAAIPMGCLPTEPEEDNAADLPEAAPAKFIKPPDASKATDDTASVEELVDEWRTLAKTPLRSQLGSRHIAIANELASRGGANIEPLFKVIESEDSTPEQKVFTVASLMEAVQPSQLDRLKTMIDTSENGTTRACATMLIGQLTDDKSKALLHELADDPEGRVSMAASISLAERGDAAMRERMLKHYWEAETNDRERARIVMLVMQNPKEADFAILNDALLREDTDSFTRQSIAHIYGRIGDASVVPVLEKSIEQYPEPSFATMAGAAVKSIKARIEAASKTEAETPDPS